MVKGLRRLKTKFTRTIPKNVRAATRDALEKGADEMVALMKTTVPIEFGDLQDSINWTWGDPPKGTLTLFRSRPIGGGERISIFAGGRNSVGTVVYYHFMQEFGTKHHRAQPFFFPSYRLLRRRVRSRITRSMNKAIKDSVRVGAR